MPRKQPTTPTSAAQEQLALTLAIQPHVITPTAVYTLKGAQAALGLARGCLPREIRLGRLRVAKRAGKYLIPGQWLLEWIYSGEITRRPPGKIPGPTPAIGEPPPAG